MNISQPLASTIDAVDFSILSAQEIVQLSVKRLTQPVTFDRLVNPNPNGLYDTAMGAFMDNPCATCHLNIHSCPGHCGHIELPVRVYHCMFFDQAFRLLRAQCAYCMNLKLSRVQTNFFHCKLRLIAAGLLKEAEELDNVGLQDKTLTKSTNESTDSEESEDEGSTILVQRRSYTDRAIRRANKGNTLPHARIQRTEAIVAARRQVLADFHAQTITRKCFRCKALNPTYRKTKTLNIFRKPLSPKDRAKNDSVGIKSIKNPLVELTRIQKQQQSKVDRHRKNQHFDEAVADLGDSTHSEDEIQVFDEEPVPSDEEAGEDVASDSAVDTSAMGTASSKLKKSAKDNATPIQEPVNAEETHAALVLLFEREREIMIEMYGGNESHPPFADMFFIQNILVPPIKYRKETKNGPGDITEPPENQPYRDILTQIQVLIDMRENLQSGQRNYLDFQNSWNKLQGVVNGLIDRDKDPNSSVRSAEGVKQKLEKKEGMLRMNMMGKRVNFAARTVISPDPNIESNEIGVPPIFAKKLTFPEPVTAHSYEELKQAVINGPEIWPGAAAVEFENGQVTNLRFKTPDERQGIANSLLAPSTDKGIGARNKKVHRHLNNGDIVLMNRQPSLHKPSMMAHRAKVLPGEKTLRMHYANCKSYNADFDGDEMNMHFPQNEIARAEAMSIADTDHQYLSATAGEPLRGLIQDHISVAVHLTSKDAFFNREQYQELIYCCLRPENGHTITDRIETLQPAIIKPRALWTGKQIISTVLKNLTPESHQALYLNSKSLLKDLRWGTDSDENAVRVREGELVTGILDKKQIGPARGGLIHAVYEAYGHRVASRLLSVLGRLLTRYLNACAFSCGVEDLILTDQGETDRSKTLAGADMIGLGTAARYVSLQDESPKSDDKELLSRLEEVMRDDSKLAGLDAAMTGKCGELSTAITMNCLPNGLIKLFPKNQMQNMTASGAKGSNVNANLISCNLGQQVLEGRRVPVMVSGKTLPSFKPFEPSIRAGGYIVDRFLTGIRPQEYFFHAMAGREGLIDTAVKTASSGYLQRCVIKSLEGLTVQYDGTVRDSDGTIIQTLYGEDGLDVTKAQSLTDYAFLANNFTSFFASLNLWEVLERKENKDALKWNKKVAKSIRRFGHADSMDPGLSVFNPYTSMGSTSESFYATTTQFLDKNVPKKGAGVLLDTFRNTKVSRSLYEGLADFYYMRCLVEPGEAVGVVAGQSIGEPSTQMTLNTFHLAGHAAKNVTLGMPRLREILMTASMKPKTPLMTMFFRPGTEEETKQTFVQEISRRSLSEIIDKTSVEESLEDGIYPNSRTYTIRLDFYPKEEYTKEYKLKPGDVAHAVEYKFVPRLIKQLKDELRKRGGRVTDSKPELGKAVAKGEARKGPENPQGEEQTQAEEEAGNEGGDSDIDDAGDDDAGNAKQRQNRDEGVSYEDNEDGEKDGDSEDDSDQEAKESKVKKNKISQNKNKAGSDVDPDHGPNDAEAEDVEMDIDISNGTDMESDKAGRESRIMEKYPDITSFKLSPSSLTLKIQYDSRTPKLLVHPLVNLAAHSSVVQETPGIDSALIQKPEPGDKIKESYVLAAGFNVKAMQEQYHDVLALDSIRTNDIGAMLQIYGVEAARETIVAELNAVFAGHGIDVDRRHLTLVADFMTRNGGFTPFSRTGLRNSASLLAKMSFETTTAFLRDAAMFGGEHEMLNGPSARIAVGRVSKMGTGAFEVRMPVTGLREVVDKDEMEVEK